MPQSISFSLKTKPKITKHKADTCHQEKWKFSSSNFYDKQNSSVSLSNSTEKIDKEIATLHNKKFVDNRSLSEVFLHKTRRAVKRKSITEVTNVTHDFREINKNQVLPLNTSTNSYFHISTKHQNLLPKKDHLFSIEDIQTTFKIDESCKKTNSVVIKSSLTDFNENIENRIESSVFLDVSLSRNEKKPKTDSSTNKGSALIISNDYSKLNDPALCSFQNAVVGKPSTCDVNVNKRSNAAAFCDIVSSDFDSKKSLLQPFVSKVKRRPVSSTNNYFTPQIASNSQNSDIINLTKSDLIKCDKNKSKSTVFLNINDSNFNLKKSVNALSVNEIKKKPISIVSNDFSTLEFSEFNTHLFIEEEEIYHDSSQEDNNLTFKNNRTTFSNFSIISKNESIGYGSNWVQNLHLPTDEQPVMEGKKKIRNILSGGFAEELIKLQRREQFEKAVCDYKNYTNTNLDTMSMTIISTFSTNEIVITKCFSNTSNNEYCNYESQHEEGIGKNKNGKNTCISRKTEYFVLFQKQAFHKQQLKPGSVFLLLQPWHELDVNSLRYPVIFCTYFKNTFSSDDGPKKSKHLEDKKSLYKSLSSNFKINASISRSCHENDIFYYKWKTDISINVRIQRIWERNSTFKENLDFIHQTYYKRLSLLLQSEKGMFYELIISLKCQDVILQNWLKHLSNLEGKCFTIPNLKVVHRLHYKKNTKLFIYLQFLLKKTKGENFNQDFIYQLAVDKISEMPKEITRPYLPEYLSYSAEPLIHLFKNNISSNRFSCVAKVIFIYKDMLYISDESILYAECTTYVKLKILYQQSILIGSEIIIKEAVINKNALVLDEYSQIVQVQPEQSKFASINFQSMKLSLNMDSSLDDIAFVKGEIVSVDENEAYSWLQCNICSKENLVEDSMGNIYCEDCFQIINNPLLNVKMSVTLASEELPNILLNIQLLSPTIKKILLLDNVSTSPQCTVGDILGKKIGPLLCYIKGKEINQKILYLTEINPL